MNGLYGKRALLSRGLFPVYPSLFVVVLLESSLENLCPALRHPLHGGGSIGLGRVICSAPPQDWIA